MDPKLAPPGAGWVPSALRSKAVPAQGQRVNINSLLSHLSEKYPAYLEHFFHPELVTASTEDLIELDDDDTVMMPSSSSSQPSAQPAAAKECETLPRTQSTSGSSAQSTASARGCMSTPPGPSAQTSSSSPTVGNGDITADVEMPQGFTTVTRNKKRKLKVPKSQADPPSKITKDKTSSRSMKPPYRAQADPTMESEDSNMSDPPRERVPPLYVRDKARWERLLPMLVKEGITFTDARSTAIGIRVQCPDSNNHRRLTAILREEKIGFHTYALKEERVLRAVIRGLPRELNTELIKEDLVAQGIPVLEVHRMYNRRTKTPYDMVLVIANIGPEGKKIWRISSVCRLSGLKVQEPQGRGRMSQCHNCMVYGHSARFCFTKPRCVKCLLDHSTSDCPRKQPTEEPPSCVLCGTQGHPANYRGCSKAPKGPWRKVPSTGPKRAPEKFIPAPPPATNAWSRPLNSGTPAPPANASPPRATTTARAPAAEPAPAPKPAPAPTSTPAQSAADDAFASNWQYINRVIDVVDMDELDAFVQASRSDPVLAVVKYSKLIRAVSSLRNNLNG